MRIDHLGRMVKRVAQRWTGNGEKSRERRNARKSDILKIRGSDMETARIGKRGTLVIPSKLRQRFALREGDLLVTEEREDGILLRPAVAVPVEIYTAERKAEFLLNNAVSQRDYDDACAAIREMGLDPGKIPNTGDVRREDLPTDEEFVREMKTIRRNSAKRRA
jgi:AbrB family looped-hinge helix DNA binding protein